jgi:hypothetical protein
LTSCSVMSVSIAPFVLTFLGIAKDARNSFMQRSSPCQDDGMKPSRRDVAVGEILENVMD